jgi:hypothetical protein
MKWIVDTQAAEVLSNRGHQWRQVDLQPSQIDVAESGKNLARPEPLDKALVSEYAQAMKADATFPMIVVAKLPGISKLVIVGGNHRFHAAIEAGGKSVAIRAMMVELTKHEFWLLAKALNVVNGKREDRDTRAEQAIELVKNHSLTIPQAANAMGVDPHTVRTRIHVDDLRLAMVRHGVVAKEPPNDFAKSFTDWLEDEDTRDATKQLLACKLDSETLRNVRQQIKNAKSGAARREVVEAAVKQAGGAPKTGSRVTGPRAVILRAAATLGRLAMQHKTLAELQMSVDDAVLALQQLSFLVELLCDLPEVCGARANVALDDGTKAALRKLQQFRQKQMTQSTSAVNNGG